MKERFPFVQAVSLKKSLDSDLSFQLALLYSVVLPLFPLTIAFFVFMHSLQFVGAISSNADKVILINPSAKVFVFGDFTVHHKDWLTYSQSTATPGELCYNFSISNDLT